MEVYNYEHNSRGLYTPTPPGHVPTWRRNSLHREHFTDLLIGFSDNSSSSIIPATVHGKSFEVFISRFLWCLVFVFLPRRLMENVDHFLTRSSHYRPASRSSRAPEMPSITQKEELSSQPIILNAIFADYKTAKLRRNAKGLPHNSTTRH